MILTKKNRIEDFTKRGWWGEDTLYSLFQDAVTSSGDQEALVDPENREDMLGYDKKGNVRNWILEIHFVDAEKQIGGFFEQLLA